MLSQSGAGGFSRARKAGLCALLGFAGLLLDGCRTWDDRGGWHGHRYGHDHFHDRRHERDHRGPPRHLAPMAVPKFRPPMRLPPPAQSTFVPPARQHWHHHGSGEASRRPWHHHRDGGKRHDRDSGREHRKRR